MGLLEGAIPINARDKGARDKDITVCRMKKHEPIDGRMVSDPRYRHMVL
jgi:hypothetical protein